MTKRIRLLMEKARAGPPIEHRRRHERVLEQISDEDIERARLLAARRLEERDWLLNLEAYHLLPKPKSKKKIKQEVLKVVMRRHGLL